MAQIIPKLNLNKTPALAEDNSLIFAKNIRLDVDGTIHRDYGTFPMSIHKGNNTSSVVNYSNLLNRIISDIETDYKKFSENDYSNEKNTYKVVYNNLSYISDKNTNSDFKPTYNIVGIISASDEFYIFINGSFKPNQSTETKVINCIIRYDEKEDRFYPCGCNWTWSGGTITGCVINNLVGDKILNIGEYNTSKLVPFKSINLNISTINDDESVYTQVPKIPITNLNYSDKFSCVIPNGVYQFFVRYKIQEDFYTDWFLASKEIFVGNQNSVITSFGSLSYVNTHRDSDNSFILSVEHLIEQNKDIYKSFQIGFILTHDDATYARAWKHFDFNINKIQFDYKATDSEELEVTDLLKSTYALYNVGNITSFKNKLYISNYTESNFNEDLQSVADNVNIQIKTQEGSETYNNRPIKESVVGGKKVISGLIIDGVDTSFIGENGIFDQIITTSVGDRPSIKQAIINACSNDVTTANNTYSSSIDIEKIRIISRCDTLNAAKNTLPQKYKNVNTSNSKISYTFDYKTYDVSSIIIDGASANNSSDIISAIINRSRFLTKNVIWVNSSGQTSDKITIKIGRKCSITKYSSYYNGGSGFQPFIPKLDTYPEDTHDSTSSFKSISNNTSNDSLIGTGDATGSWTNNSYIFEDTYYQEIEITFIAWKNEYNSGNSVTLVDNTTLIPYQKYKFYIHFVKDTGEITNGYYCSNAGEITAPFMPTCSSIIYPVFSNINIPQGYSACFFSISHCAVNAATIFNIENSTDSAHKEGSCIDIDMMLIPGNKNIYIRQGTAKPNVIAPTEDNNDNISDDTTEIEVETHTGTYYYSSDSSIPRYFGANGVVVFDKGQFSDDKGKLAYAITDYAIPESEIIELTKCTPYLNDVNLDNKSYKEFVNMNLLGFICSVTPLIREVCMNYYSDGSSVYFKRNNEDNIGIYNPTGTLYLDELSKYNDAASEKKLSNFSLKISDNVIIYSNYNLNYVTLSEEPKMSIKTYYNRPANSSGVATESQINESSTILLRLIPSQIMSDIYTLPAMYKDYIRKTFYSYDEDNNVRFENTVRSSILYGDENRVNLLKFDANDYYNIPTNRGIIVNLVSVGDAILVHTKDSMFKFSGGNTLSSSDGEIQVPESKPFDTGVSEVFGSDFGFAGIQNKSDYIITENGYIFFDRDSRIVYLYRGNGQIIKVSESIEKLFRHKDIDNITFANDYYNNRFFMSILFYDKNEDKTVTIDGEPVIQRTHYPVTLSFNVSEQIKAFVSLHDFYYNYAFNTKTKCYFLTLDSKDICSVDKTYKGSYTKIELHTDKTYPNNKTTFSIIITNEDTDTGMSLEQNFYSYSSIVDVICNTQYELIKTLNSVNWCGMKVKQEFANIDANKPESLTVAEDINYDIPCDYIRIYSDSCMTPLNSCTKRSNDESITSMDSYQYPRYNQGIWTFNYFRNILNAYNNGKRLYANDENSLIEGKYFVVRFVFNEDFKLETLTLNYNIKQ